jgi:hypothetical protein
LISRVAAPGLRDFHFPSGVAQDILHVRDLTMYREAQS